MIFDQGHQQILEYVANVYSVYGADLLEELRVFYGKDIDPYIDEYGASREVNELIEAGAIRYKGGFISLGDPQSVVKVRLKK